MSAPRYTLLHAELGTQVFRIDALETPLRANAALEQFDVFAS